ncbi:hypothetical protein, partial [Azospirillum soli]|uniref:hypothetical protein n=1 Tax=Azospirillum soli TaxID=1304799 RepID=UPI001AE3DA72
AALWSKRHQPLVMSTNGLAHRHFTIHGAISHNDRKAALLDQAGASIFAWRMFLRVTLREERRNARSPLVDR